MSPSDIQCAGSNACSGGTRVCPDGADCALTCSASSLLGRNTICRRPVSEPAPVAAADRSAAPVDSESEIGGANRGLLLVGVAAALVTVILIANDDNEDEAVSP